MQKISRNLLLFLTLLFFTIYQSCSSLESEQVAQSVQKTAVSLAGFGLEKLSEYAFFKGKMADLLPAEGVLPYDLNMPLFSDYSHKARFVKVPEGTTAAYNDKQVFEFPVGSVLIKNFFYPNDFRDASKGRKIMETRLLIHEEKGWKALPYIWNDDQTEAYLEVAGGRKDISWVHEDGSVKTLNYSVPNVNQCKGCHVSGSAMVPIGPSARQLNRMFSYADGITNQLEKWRASGIIRDLPENVADCPKVPDWENPADGNLESRARAYLEINCAHCHSKNGPANTSGLFLDVHETNPTNLGFFKSPVAAGRGSGNLLYDLVPGKPHESITVFRMNSDDPGIMMPELGRKLIHEEGVKLISDWIASLKEESAL